MTPALSCRGWWPGTPRCGPTATCRPPAWGGSTCPGAWRTRRPSWPAGPRTVDQRTVVLLGMGGSSLGPAVLEAVLTATGTPGGPGRATPTGRVRHHAPRNGGRARSLRRLRARVLQVGDHPRAQRAASAHAWAQLPDPSRYAVITDPGTPLAPWPRSWAFARCFENPPDIGGRYSVLSYFGMVPAALIGYDVAELCERALDADRDEAAGLGMAMGEDAKAGRDKVTIVVDPSTPRSACGSSSSSPSRPASRARGAYPCPPSSPRRAPTATSCPFALGSPADLGDAVLPLGAGHRRRAGTSSGSTRSTSPTWPSRRRTPTTSSPTSRCPRSRSAPPTRSLDLAQRTTPPRRLRVAPGLRALRPGRRRSRRCAAASATTWAAGHHRRLRSALPALDRPAPQGRPDTGRGRPDRRRRRPGPSVAIPGKPYDFGTLIAAQAIGDHREPARPRAAGSCGWPSTTWASIGRPESGGPTVADDGPRAAKERRHMKIGMVGLGKMGANMTQRLIENGHQVVAFDLSERGPARRSPPTGPRPPPPWRSWSAKLDAPRVAWVMVPAGAATDDDHRHAGERSFARATSSSTAATPTTRRPRPRPPRWRRRASASSTPAPRAGSGA